MELMNGNQINYSIDLLTQTESSNCVQTSVAMLLNYYKQKFTPEEIQAEIPVRHDSQGKPYGTLLMDIAVWIKSLGFNVTLDCFDTEIIDRSWRNLDSQEIKIRLTALRESTRQTVVTTEIRNTMIDSYVNMLEQGVNFRISKVNRKLFDDLLSQGPFLAIISYNYLYDAPRDRYIEEEKKYKSDDIEGKTTAHAVVVTGMDNENIFVNDPDKDRGGQNSFPIDDSIAAIATAQNKASNWILSING